MGAAEARALWQRRASRCYLVHEDATMPPRLACCHHQQQQHSSSPSSGKNSFSSSSFGDSSDFSSDTKWWLKGSSNFDEEIANSFHQDTKLHEFVDLTGISKEKEEEDYSFISKKDTATTPWWRSTTDQDELALLVSTRSLDHHHIQNCDLPPPQKLHKSIHCTSGGDKGFQRAVIKSQSWKQHAWSDRSDRSLSHSSSNSTDSKNTSPKSDDLSKAQLLEALRHSQTRAREAEKAAKEACAEKDRLVTVLMRQASQILAYKQWVKFLEMESLYLQMKREQEEEQGHVEGMNLKKRKQRGKKKGEIGRYMMAFALGFSLIGAGLLLGWTVGWLFPF